VFVVDDEFSFSKLSEWIPGVRNVVSTPLPLIIAGNKTDLPEHVITDAAADKRGVSRDKRETTDRGCGAVYTRREFSIKKPEWLVAGIGRVKRKSQSGC
jgi:hypothetical protein